MTKLLLTTFYDFLIHHFKKMYKVVFLNLKKTKNTYSRTLEKPRVRPKLRPALLQRLANCVMCDVYM